MANEEPKGLGGWLILVGLGVVVSTIQLGLACINLYIPIFTDGTFTVLTTPGTDSYHALWGPILLAEMVFHVGLFLLSSYMTYLYFARDFLFPRIYISLITLSLVSIPIDAWLVSFVITDQPIFDETTRLNFLRGLAAAVIWIPYMLISKRVANTFVIGRPRTEEVAS